MSISKNEKEGGDVGVDDAEADEGEADDGDDDDDDGDDDEGFVSEDRGLYTNTKFVIC